jgi:hypothetical protein
MTLTDLITQHALESPTAAQPLLKALLPIALTHATPEALLAAADNADEFDPHGYVIRGRLREMARGSFSLGPK